jgi:hypothetical protein
MLLTNRDIEILGWLYECRFLLRKQLQALSFSAGAASSCKRRLTLLYHNGYIGRLTMPVPAAFGATRAVYHLDRRGAGVLATTQREAYAGWRERDRDREQIFLSHTLDINDVRIAFTLATRSRGFEMDWISEADLRKQGIRQRVSGPGNGSPLFPDAYFTIVTPAGADGFALEVDRGTVTEQRMRARFRAYGEWAVSGRYRTDLPVASFRVLVAVTDSRRDPQRLARLKAWCEDEGGRSLFWFAGRAPLDADILSEPIWEVAGETGCRRLALGSDDG